MSNAAISVVNQDLGACRVTYNGVDLGSTLNKVVLTVKYHKAHFKSDQTGDTVLDSAIHGMDITVTTDLAETRDKTKWLVAFPSADLLGISPANYLDFKDKMGLRDLPRAQALILHPLVEADASLNFDHYFWKALATEESGLTMGPGEQYKLKLVWRIYPDVSVTPFRFYRFGDHTL